MTTSINANNTSKAATEATAKLAGAVLDTVLEAATADEAHENIAKLKAEAATNQTEEPTMSALDKSKAIKEATRKVDMGSVMASGLLGALACGMGRATSKLVLEGIAAESGTEIETQSWGEIGLHALAVGTTAAATTAIVQKTVLKNIHEGYDAGVAVLIGTGCNLVDALVGDVISGKVRGLRSKEAVAEEHVEVTEEQITELAHEVAGE